MVLEALLDNQRIAMIRLVKHMMSVMQNVALMQAPAGIYLIYSVIVHGNVIKSWQLTGKTVLVGVIKC